MLTSNLASHLEGIGRSDAGGGARNEVGAPIKEFLEARLLETAACLECWKTQELGCQGSQNRSRSLHKENLRLDFQRPTGLLASNLGRHAKGVKS